MTKAVYRPGELELVQKKIILDPPTAFPELSHLAEVEELEELVPEDIETYEGPTADDLRREAEAFKMRWDEEKAIIIQSAKDEAEKIIKDAEEQAFKIVKKQTDESQVAKRNAMDEAESILAEANEKVRQIEAESAEAAETRLKEAEENGYTQGRDAGYNEGKTEVERLISRTQTILERANNKRAEILAESEQEIIDLVLLITRKVVKLISENQKNIIVPNIVQALRKIKDRGDFIIRVNLADLKLATENKKEFIQLVEGVKSIQIIEDSTVDEGGCIIETDFGEIDARISSQLAELESKILEISPMRSKAKK